MPDGLRLYLNQMFRIDVDFDRLKGFICFRLDTARQLFLFSNLLLLSIPLYFQ